MVAAEVGLYFASRALRSTSVAHSPEMKAALADIDRNDAYRAKEIARVDAALKMLRLSVAGKRVMDFGCNDGALSVGYLATGASGVIGVDVERVVACTTLRGTARIATISI